MFERFEPSFFLAVIWLVCWLIWAAILRGTSKTKPVALGRAAAFVAVVGTLVFFVLPHINSMALRSSGVRSGAVVVVVQVCVILIAAIVGGVAATVLSKHMLLKVFHAVVSLVLISALSWYALGRMSVRVPEYQVHAEKGERLVGASVADTVEKHAVEILLYLESRSGGIREMRLSSGATAGKTGWRKAAAGVASLPVGAGLEGWQKFDELPGAMFEFPEGRGVVKRVVPHSMVFVRGDKVEVMVGVRAPVVLVDRRSEQLVSFEAGTALAHGPMLLAAYTGSIVIYLPREDVLVEVVGPSVDDIE